MFRHAKAEKRALVGRSFSVDVVNSNLSAGMLFWKQFVLIWQKLFF